MTGVAIAGSIAEGHPDIYSDVDLIVVIDDEAFDAVMGERLTLIGSWAALVAGFTGEHVGEPRLIITLVGPPLLHVDFKFVRACDFAQRVEDPEILWDRDGGLADSLAEYPSAPPSLDLCEAAKAAARQEDRKARGARTTVWDDLYAKPRRALSMVGLPGRAIAVAVSPCGRVPE